MVFIPEQINLLFVEDSEASAQDTLNALKADNHIKFNVTRVKTLKEALEFLRYARELGVSFFDTAPAYGYSEERLGRFLQGMPDSERRRIFVATKCGEEYDVNTETGYTDHSPENLRRSIER